MYPMEHENVYVNSERRAKKTGENEERKTAYNEPANKQWYTSNVWQLQQHLYNQN